MKVRCEFVQKRGPREASPTTRLRSGSSLHETTGRKSKPGEVEGRGWRELGGGKNEA